MRSRSAFRSCFAMILVFSVLSGVTHAGPKWGKISDEEWKTTAPAKYPEANAVILFDICSLTVTIDAIEVARHMRVKVLTGVDISDVADVTIDYYDGDKIRDFKAQTIKPDGKCVKVDEKQVHVKQSGDYRTRVFTFPVVEPGCILEFSYRNVNERYWRLDPWYFQSGLYTLMSSMTLVLGPGFSYVTAFTNVPSGDRQGVAGEILQAGGRPHKTFTWTRQNLMPLKDEPYMGAVNDFRSSIHSQLVSYDNGYSKQKFISNWTDLGVEYQKYLDQKMRGGELGDLQNSILSGVIGSHDKIARLYEYVTREIAHKESDDGSKYTHEDFTQLLADKSGTGTEKNLLLCALIRKAGLKAYPVLISTRDHVRFNPEIYQLDQFNYIITYAEFDSSILFMDAASKYCPLGMLPSDKLVDGGFLVDEKESQLVNVLRDEPKSYRYDVTNVFIDSTGGARCSTSCAFSGYFAPTWGQLRDESTPDQFMKDYISGRIDTTATIESNNFGVDSLGRCHLDAVYLLKDWVRVLDKNLVLKPIGYRFRTNPFTAAKRYFPLDFEFAQTYQNITLIRSDRPLTANQLPPPVDVSIAGGSFHRIARVDEGIIRVESKLELTQPAFAPAAYDDVKRLFDAVAASYQDDIVVATAQ